MIKAILFDLDGTLLDTLADLANGVNAALAKGNYPQRSIQDIRSFIGNGVANLIKKSLPPVSDAAHAQCLNDFHQFYEQMKEDHTACYEGIEALLNALQAKNIRMGVVTNKPQHPAEMLVKRFFPFMEVTIGYHESRERKPSAEPLLLALNKMGVKKEDVYYVGDSEVDIMTAINAGVKPIGVTWGFRDKEALLAFEGTVLIDHPLELLTFTD